MDMCLNIASFVTVTEFGNCGMEYLVD